MLNTTATQSSPFTHNDSKLFTLISNDVTQPTLHNTSQFRVRPTIYSKWGRDRGVCVRGTEQAGRGWGRGRTGVYSVVEAGSASGFFPLPQRWHSLRCGETPPVGPKWRHDAEAESVSLTDLFWVYFTVTCFSLRFFTVTFLAFVVGSLYFHSMQVVNIQTFDMPTIKHSVQYTCSGYSKIIYSPYYCKLSLYFFFTYLQNEFI